MKSHQPFVERDVAVFHDRANSDRKLAPAPTANMQTLASVKVRSLFTLQLSRFADYSAVRANRTIRPQFGFKPLTGSIFILVLATDQSHELSMR